MERVTALKEHVFLDLFPGNKYIISRIKNALASDFFIFCTSALFYQTTEELSRNATFAVTPQKTGAKLGQLPAKDKMEWKPPFVPWITCKVSKDTEIWLSGTGRSRHVGKRAGNIWGAETTWGVGELAGQLVPR